MTITMTVTASVKATDHTMSPIKMESRLESVDWRMSMWSAASWFALSRLSVSAEEEKHVGTFLLNYSTQAITSSIKNGFNIHYMLEWGNSH